MEGVTLNQYIVDYLHQGPLTHPLTNLIYMEIQLGITIPVGHGSFLILTDFYDRFWAAKNYLVYDEETYLVVCCRGITVDLPSS